MAWIRVESSVARHRKFMQAGPAASWLWLCGVGYCQDGLTDGFIPTEALDFLGVKQAKPLMARLVAARLWDVVDGGWRIHDYLDENKAASEVRRIKQARREGGKLGGRPNLEGKPSDKPSALKDVNLTENPSTPTSTSTSTTTPTSTSTPRAHGAPPESDERLDFHYAAFRDAYPEAGRKGSYLIQQQFIVEAQKAGGPDRLMSALANHVASEQWSNPKMIPGMDKWLKEERWRQTLAPAGSMPVQNSRLPQWAR